MVNKEGPSLTQQREDNRAEKKLAAHRAIDDLFNQVTNDSSGFDFFGQIGLSIDIAGGLYKTVEQRFVKTTR